MKKLRLRFSIFCLCVLCVACIPISKPIFNIDTFQNVTYYYYTYAISHDINSAKVVKNGDYSIVICDSNSYKSVKKQLPIILGESIKISNYTDSTLKYIENQYKRLMIKEEIVNNYEIMLCYDKSLSKSILIDNMEVNLQVAISSNEICIGYPLILNGF